MSGFKERFSASFANTPDPTATHKNKNQTSLFFNNSIPLKAYFSFLSQVLNFLGNYAGPSCVTTLRNRTNKGVLPWPHSARTNADSGYGPASSSSSSPPSSASLWRPKATAPNSSPPSLPRSKRATSPVRSSPPARSSPSPRSRSNPKPPESSPVSTSTLTST